MLNFCINEIKGIEFKFIQKNYLNLFRAEDSF